MGELKKAALELAMDGWQVFPCHLDKSPKTRHGFKSGTSDLEQVEWWWTMWPGASIGAVVPEHLLILDIDPRNGGSLDRLEETFDAELPSTMRVLTGGGGTHLYFLRPRGEFYSGRGLPRGVDLKLGESGYVIMPPSPHPSGGRYQWSAPAGQPQPIYPVTGATVPPPLGYADAAEPAALPENALQVLSRPVVRKPVVRVPADQDNGLELAYMVAGAQEGERNNVLFWALCRVYERGLSDEARDLVCDAGLWVGLSAREIARTAQSAVAKVGGDQ